MFSKFDHFECANCGKELVDIELLHINYKGENEDSN